MLKRNVQNVFQSVSSFFLNFKRHYFEQKRKIRAKKYAEFLNLFNQKEIFVYDIVQFGYTIMQNEKIHPHFFMNNSLYETARYLTCYALKLPYEMPSQIKNRQNLKSQREQQDQGEQQEQREKQEQQNQKNNGMRYNITLSQAKKVIDLFEKRIAERLPVEYITQEAWYLGNKFYVNESVLVPRSLMNTRFPDFLHELSWENHRILDLCSGSGCIGISLALINPNVSVDLADISLDALEVSKKNVSMYSLNNRIKCIQSDLFSHISGKYDLIISNPPYVSLAEYEQSPLEFKREPKLALVAPKNGIGIIDNILKQAKDFLNPNGKIIIETGYLAAKRLKKRYPYPFIKWYTYKRPKEEQSKFTTILDKLFGMDCILECHKKDLDF